MTLNEKVVHCVVVALLLETAQWREAAADTDGGDLL